MKLCVWKEETGLRCCVSLMAEFAKSKQLKRSTEDDVILRFCLNNVQELDEHYVAGVGVVKRCGQQWTITSGLFRWTMMKI